MKIQLSDHFTYKKLIRFTLPSIVMMIFTSIYGVVDGLFVSNFVGKTPFAALNLIMPFLMIFSAIGFMIGTGGSALVSMTLGEGRREKANSLFSMLIYITIGSGVVFGVLGLVFLRPVARLLGAEGEMLEYCVEYGRVLAPALPFFMLQNTFQSFLITAEKPHFGLAVTVAAGVTNIVLDALFVAVFHWGLTGAAVATLLSQMVGGLVPLIFFFTPNSSLLRLGRCKFDGKALLKTCTNGSSEMMTNISLSLVNMLYNFQLMRFAGEDGVAAYGVVMYAAFIFLGVFAGYSSGSSPIMGYHYGAQNHQEMKNVLKKSLKLLGGAAVVLTALAMLGSRLLASIFVGYDAELLDLTARAFVICAIPFLFMWFNIYASAFFTALNDGAVSAAISFMRALVLPIICILVLPAIWQMDGVWFSLVASEALGLLVSIGFMLGMRKKYHY